MQGQGHRASDRVAREFWSWGAVPGGRLGKGPRCGVQQANGVKGMAAIPRVARGVSRARPGTSSPEQRSPRAREENCFLLYGKRSATGWG